MTVRSDTTASSSLSAYFPRFALAWALDEPDQTWRAIDASLVFVDISGFTALSERLARRGHQGAEELTQTLSTCFADLLVAAYADGGSLVKFGGDALFLLFDGDDHAERAARSALQMRARLAKSGRITTSVGAIRLRMSAGVHSGAVHLFRVGSSHKEVLIAGPGPSTVVAMEQTASAGQIVISPGTAERIAPRLVGPAAGPGYFLRSRPRLTPDVSFEPPGAIELDASIGVPAALRDHLAASVEPEHRQATVAFIRFDGIDDVITADGPAVAATVLDELVRDVQAAVDAEGVTFLGSDADKDGGKLIIVGGAPSALDDTEGRVLRAMRRVLDGERRLPIRIGVNHGHAFVGEVGPGYRRTYTVMGDTVNLAARLMASASPGQLRATAGVLDRAATEFDTTELEPFFVKGKAKPVEAFLVGERTRRRTRAVTDLAFVGRDDERLALSAALAAMRSGSGGLIDISGEAGVGKSRLLRELRAEAPEVPTVTAYCETYEAKTPYFAARYLLRGALGIKKAAAGAGDVLRAVVAENAPELLPWLPLVGAVVDVPVAATPESTSLDPLFLREHTARVVVELLDALVPGQQFFVVEDAQWVDDLSAEILVAIAKRARERRWLVAIVRRLDRGGYRPGEETTVRLVLHPLDEADSAALLESAVGEEYLLRPDQIESIVDRAGGNPLFLEQLAQATVAGSGEAALSDSLEAVVAAQIDTLPSADRRALLYAAVLGPMFEAAHLGELVAAEGGDVRATARRLRGFLEPSAPGWLRFRNQCYREVAYETLSFRRRKELHARAGASIEAAMTDAPGDRAEILSFHFLHAQEYAKCWDYALAAAERAKAKYANVEAVALYERALTAGAQLGDELRPQVADAYESLGGVALDGALFERAKTAFARARSLAAGDDLRVARLCRLESLVAMNRGHESNAVRWVNKGLKLLDGASDAHRLRQRAELRGLRGEQLHRVGENRKALKWAELAIADAVASDNRAALARAYTVADLARFKLGQSDSIDRLRRALEIWTELEAVREQATVLTVLGATLYWKGEWDEAVDMFTRSRDAYSAAGDLVTVGYGTTNIAEILLDQGRNEEVTGLHEAIHLWRAVGHPRPVAGALTMIGRAALQRGDVMKARDVFDQARWSADDVGRETVEYDYWIAECMIREGDAADALTLLEHALRAERARGSALLVPRLCRGIGYAQLALGEHAGAEAAFGDALGAARSNSSPYEAALSLDGLIAVAEASGLTPDPDAERERDETFARLGVRATFPPLAAAS
ncbi:MAG TPA: adenylate/guanylate cyclase domain-containing protein [Acidimicrobiales bacterium]|nr:adenylate/guanylate cyclase domain-containing protein [Acidimicrobiales bacterium]